MIKVDIDVGVKDLSIQLKHPCEKNHCLGEIRLSFKIKGDFIDAAMNDDYQKVVDYYLLSKELKATLKKYKCVELDAIKKEAMKTILGFSLNISKGYLNIFPICHLPL